MESTVEDGQSQDAGQSCRLFVLWLISGECYANMRTYQPFFRIRINLVRDVYARRKFSTRCVRAPRNYANMRTYPSLTYISLQSK